MVLPPGRGQVIFHMKDVELVSQLIEGSFPDLEQVIPRRYKTRAVLSTSAFQKACKQAEIFAREGSHIARISVQSAGEMQPGQVEISGQSEETGSNQTVIDATIEGNNQVIAFNVQVPARSAGCDQNPERGPGDHRRHQSRVWCARWAKTTSCT